MDEAQTMRKYEKERIEAQQDLLPGPGRRTGVIMVALTGLEYGRF